MNNLSKKFYSEFIFLISLGMVTSISLPPLNYSIINFLTFSTFFVFLIKKSNQHKNRKFFFLYGWLFGFGYFATNLYWISISLSFDQNFKFLIPLTIFLIPSFLAIFYGVISYFFITFKSNKIVSSLLIFSLIFGIVEFLRGYILTGFPWNLIAYSFSNQIELLSATTILGTYGFNLFCITLFTSPAILILKKTKTNLITFIFLLIITAFFFTYGFFYKNKFENIEKKSYEYKIRVIGSNISLQRFYANLDPVYVIEDLIKISNPDPKEKIIFLWPEGILPSVLQEEIIEFNWLFNKNFNKNHLIIMGINAKSNDENGSKHFNSISVYNHKLDLLDSYYKINLVPFGEFLPLEKILMKIGLRSLTNNYQSFSKGDKRQIIELKKENFILRILPLICYEIIYSGEIYDDFNFDLIINVSEDGWFGTSTGPEQHFVHSIFRAVENGKYVLRSANNGIAAIINPLGAVEKKVNFGKSGFIDLKEYRKIQPTVFSKYGNKIFLLLILLYIFLIISFNRFKNE